MATQLIRFSCSCGQHIEVDSNIAGNDIECPSCGNTLIVPERSEEPARIPPKAESKLKPCPMCGHLTSPTAEHCPACGHVLKKPRGIAKTTIIAVVCVLATVSAIPLLIFFITLFVSGVKQAHDEVQTKPPPPPLTEVEKSRASLLKAHMREMSDEFGGTKFLQFQYDSLNSYCAACIASDGSGPELMLTLQYKGDDWLFINSFKFKVGGRVISVNADVKRNASNGAVFESAVLSYDQASAALHAINNCGNEPVLLRYDGEGVYDRTLTHQEIQSIRDTILVYRSMGGGW